MGLRSRSKMLSFMTRENLRDQIVYLFTVKEFNCPRNDRNQEIADLYKTTVKFSEGEAKILIGSLNVKRQF